MLHSAGCRWLFWGFFCSYLVIGGYFNLLIHCINNHRWRFSFQSQMVVLVQSGTSTIFILLASVVPVGAYAWLRGSLTAAWFSVTIFILLSMELTLARLQTSFIQSFRKIGLQLK